MTDSTQTGDGADRHDDPVATHSGDPDTLFDRRLIEISVVVVLGVIMSILDTTVVNVAIDTLARDFNATLSTIQWVSTGYMLALAAVIPLTGWASHRFGTKRLFITSMALFLVGSIAAGAAWSAESLIVFRVLQGIGGGMIMPSGMTILTQTAGPTRVGRMMGVIGVPMLLAPIIGPILGGWLVDDVSWRWIFYVNVPIGMVALPLAVRFLERDKPQPGERLDWLGFSLLSPGLALFVYGLAETGPHGSFSDPAVYTPMLAGALLIGTFIAHALRSSSPLIDVRLFRHKTMGFSSLTTGTLAAAFFGTLFLMPLYYQVVRGQSALHAGLLIAPQGLGAAIMMPISGRITDRRGAGSIVPFGMIFVALGLIPLTQVTDHTSYTVLALALFSMGLGMGSTMMPAMSAAFSSMTHDTVPRATSALNVIQRVGGSIGVAVLTVVLTHQLATNLPGAGRGGLQSAQSLPPEMLAKISPAIADSFGNAFLWSLGLAAVAVLPSLLLPRQGADRGGGEPQDPMLASQERATELVDTAITEF